MTDKETALAQENARLRTALRIIHTWAAFDAENGYECFALRADEVVRACRRGLGE